MTREPKCRYDDARGWVTPEHVRDCRDHACGGCKPCPKSHCALRGRCANHVEQGAGIFTCPGCIGKTRRTLRDIITRYAELPEEAADEGVDSEAMNLHGPAADPISRRARRRYAESRSETRGWCEFPREPALLPNDEHHPLAVLGRWEMALRESYGPVSTLRITLTGAVKFLYGEVLDTFAHTQEFEEFAKDIARCLSHLETVLSDSRAPEAGAPCPTCSDWLSEGRKAPRLLKRYGRAEDGSGDTWHCPVDPAHWWTHVDYRTRIDGDYVNHALVLTMSDLPGRTGIAAGTLRRWASRTFLGTDDRGEPTYGPARLKAAGRNASGRKVYRVDDALALRGERMSA